MFSQSSNYALKALVCIARASKLNQVRRLPELAKEMNSPKAFTSKILQKLVKAKLIQSNRGKNGGYSMTDQQRHETTIVDVIQAIEGNDVFNNCVMDFKQCNPKKPCLLHYQMVMVRNNMKTNLQASTIDDLLFEYLEKRVFMKRIAVNLFSDKIV